MPTLSVGAQLQDVQVREVLPSVQLSPLTHEPVDVALHLLFRDDLGQSQRPHLREPVADAVEARLMPCPSICAPHVLLSSNFRLYHPPCLQDLPRPEIYKQLQLSGRAGPPLPVWPARLVQADDALSCILVDDREVAATSYVLHT